MRKKIIASLLAAAAFGTAFHANAAVLVKEKPSFAPIEFYKSFYGVDTESERAWLVLESRIWNGDMNEKQRVRVPGLRLDSGTGAVVLDNGSQSAVCATPGTRGVGPFRTNGVIPTGQCQLRIEQVRLPVDDGFSVQQVPHTRVFLDIVN